MNKTIKLPSALADALAAEAARAGMSLPDYAVGLLTAACPKVAGVKSGADLVAYRQAEGVVGTRADITDSSAHARSLREQAERRQNAPRFL